MSRGRTMASMRPSPVAGMEGITSLDSSNYLANLTVIVKSARMFQRRSKQRVRQYLQEMPAVAPLVPRQVNKTTLAGESAAEIPDSVYLNLEGQDAVRHVRGSGCAQVGDCGFGGPCGPGRGRLVEDDRNPQGGSAAIDREAGPAVGLRLGCSERLVHASAPLGPEREARYLTHALHPVVPEIPQCPSRSPPPSQPRARSFCPARSAGRYAGALEPGLPSRPLLGACC